MRTLLDTGPLVAAAHRGDKHHQACVRLLEELPGPLLLPVPVLIEACWLINKYGGPMTHAAFLDHLHTTTSTGGFSLVSLTPGDLNRMAELVRGYPALRLDPADASVVALAERLGVRRIATLDRRDFSVVRPRHCLALTLLP
ncbi:type II toxin-antitoxin system VapC family toxin [Microbispora triticiradicis]|uniref:type II toxin-antitoxin system VapC family toxin n=1 Tax=Microbispora triticiradicis TaxID=2200763 RepID=UPI0027DDFF6B|nr:PIN domain-containing protein [Microbispora triticiradicis]